jgi:dihydroxyacetone kinase-like protein
MKTNDVVNVLVEIAKKIEKEKEYITELDAVLGDGDHWANMNKGYQVIVKKADELRELKLSDLFKKVGMLLMSTIGGSSGVLYGDAFLKASKTLVDVDEIDKEKGCEVLDTALCAIMSRGNAKPGDKTMIDSLHGAIVAYKKALEAGGDIVSCMKDMEHGAKEGMEATKDMEAHKGRATYQVNKGVGHLDPGAVTMFYQLEILAKYVYTDN